MQKPSGTPDTRARRRAVGMRSLEAVVHETDIALLDSLKARMGVASRSEVIRVLIAKADPATVTRADAAALLERAS